MSGNGSDEKVAHLTDYRNRGDEVSGGEVLRTIAKVIRDHFLEQKNVLERQNARLEDKVSRLLTGMERLLGEVEAVRSGRQDEAFARVARPDAPADLLPTLEADVAIHYPHTAGDIGAKLGFNASRVGMLLGKQGIDWGGKSEYEELTRWKPGRQRFWHHDVPRKLADVLLNREPDEFGITSKAVRTMFERYRARQDQNS